MGMIRRKIRKSRKSHKNSKAKKLLIVLFFVHLIVLLPATWLVKSKVEPHLEEIGRMRANVMVSQIVNKALNEQFYADTDMETLLIRETNEEGKTQLLRANTQAINLLVTEISMELKKQYEARPEDVYSVPIGSLLGSKFLSQASPSVDLRIRPTSVASTDFKTEFVSEGINQTKYKVYIVMDSQVKVLAPFVSETFKVSTTVLIAEAVILGEVPASYVNVPKEEVLDVAP